METKVFAARIRNFNELENSSSGGMFTALSDYFIENGDYVLCSIYNYQLHQIEFRIIDNKSDRDQARGSKYFQSKIGNSFKQAEELLQKNQDKKILFVGMGCQAEGFRRFCELKKLIDRVWIVDIICTSNPSPKLWRDYITRFDDITKISFKDKRNGWNQPTAIVVDNGKEKSIGDWLRIFYSHNADKPSCAECRFTSTVRKIDMTIGDFWHIEKSIPEFYNEKGNSVVLIYTERGLDLFENVKNKLEWIESDTNACWQNRLYTPPGSPITRKAFWKDYRKGGVDLVLKKYQTFPIWAKIILKLKNVYKRFL